MNNFNTFIGIDWSGAKAPIHTRSIAIAKCEQGQGAPAIIQCPNHKYWSRTAVGEWIKNLPQSRRTLIGIDANFGYAEKVGVQQFGDDFTYFNLWRAIEKTSVNLSNYLAAGFWEHPEYASYFWTQGKKPQHLTLPKRITEIACGEGGYGWPESPFKLIGPKQVGKGGMAAMRVALDLKKTLGDTLAIWPFEHNLAAKHSSIVITEIYPRQFLRRAGHGVSKVKTAADLNLRLKAINSEPMDISGSISDHDTDALISAAGLRYLCKGKENIPISISNPPAMTKAARTREGWIFGV